MENGRSTGGSWCFGDVEFDAARGTLRVAGRMVELDRSSRAILLLLLQNPGGDVSKERLLEAGWPSRIVHENSLAKAIGRLREALGEQGEALTSVYGHGYKLAVEPRLSALPAADASGGIAVASGPPQRRWRRAPVALVATAISLGLASLAGAYLWNSAQDDAEAQLRSEPPIIADAPDAIGRLLWVDDHPQNNIYEKRFFEDRRIAVHPVRSSADAFKLLSMYQYTVVISDMGRGDDRLAGLKLVEQMRARGNDTPFVIYTVRPDGEAQQQSQRDMAAEAGAQGIAVTPQEIRSVILRLFGNPERRAST